MGLVAGFFVVGGPGQGAKEHRDRQRISDLVRLANYVDCVARLNNKTLPEALPFNADCAAGRRLVDMRTGAAYVYQRIADSAYRVCAMFESPATLPRWDTPGLDIESGCMTHTFWL